MGGEKFYKVKCIKDMRDDVSESLKVGGKGQRVQKMADTLKITYGYVENIKTAGQAPTENMELSCRASKTYNKKYYRGIIIPINFLPGVYWRPENLPVLECEEVPDVILSRRFDCFDVGNGLYRDILGYWRRSIHNPRRDTLKYLNKHTKLSKKTIINAIRGEINPRLTTVQKILKAYGLSLALIKIDKPSETIKEGNIKFVNIVI